MIISLVIAGLVIGVDQLTKFLIYGTTAKSIVGNLLWFESTLNTGVAFSMFEGKSYIFIIISSLASLVLIWIICSKKYFTAKFEKIVFGFILGGTVGNLIDRIFFGGVRDFISLKFLNFAIFNVADMAISLSAIAFCVYLLLSMLKKDNKEDKQVVSQETNDLGDKSND